MDIKENAAYIKGLAQGLGIGEETKEGKVISALIDLVSDMSERIADLEGEVSELREYIEEIDSDLGAVEEDLYIDQGDDNYDSEFEEDFDNDFENDMDYDNSGYDELVCPSCGEIICVDQNLEISDIVCPACGEKLGDIDICDGDCSTCGGCEE